MIGTSETQRIADLEHRTKQVVFRVAKNVGMTAIGLGTTLKGYPEVGGLLAVSGFGNSLRGIVRDRRVAPELDTPSRKPNLLIQTRPLDTIEINNQDLIRP